MARSSTTDGRSLAVIPRPNHPSPSAISSRPSHPFHHPTTLYRSLLSLLFPLSDAEHVVFDILDVNRLRPAALFVCASTILERGRPSYPSPAFL